MKRNILFVAVCSLSALVFTDCGDKNNKHRESEEEIMEAVADGRNAARVFVNREWNDTMELQKQLLEAKARQSRYLIDNRPESAEAFDTAFISTIRTVRPDLYRHLRD